MDEPEISDAKKRPAEDMEEEGAKIAKLDDQSVRNCLLSSSKVYWYWYLKLFEPTQASPHIMHTTLPNLKILQSLLNDTFPFN